MYSIGRSEFWETDDVTPNEYEILQYFFKQLCISFCGVWIGRDRDDCVFGLEVYKKKVSTQRRCHKISSSTESSDAAICYSINCGGIHRDPKRSPWREVRRLAGGRRRAARSPAAAAAPPESGRAAWWVAAAWWCSCAGLAGYSRYSPPGWLGQSCCGGETAAPDKLHKLGITLYR